MGQSDWREVNSPLDAASVLRLALGLLSVLLLVDAAVAIGTTTDYTKLFVHAGLLAILGAAALALRRGQVRRVGIGLVIGLYVAMTAAVAMLGGLHSANAVSTYLLIVALAGLVWSGRAALGLSGVVAVTLAVIGLLQAQNVLPAASSAQEQSLAYLFTGSALSVLLMGSVLYLIMNRLQLSSEESQRSAAASRQSAVVSRRSEERLSGLVQGAPAGLIVVDEAQRVISVNPSGVRILGGDHVALVGSSLFRALRTDEEDAGALAHNLDLARGGKAVGSFELDVGSDAIPAKVSLHGFVSDEGRPHVLVTLDDLTEQRRFEAERAALEEQLRLSQKMEALGKLAGGVAHDFNNLLTIILGHGEELLEGLRDQPELLEDAEVVHDAANRAAVLTRQLLAFARRQPAVTEKFDLNERVRDMERMFGRLISDEVELRIELDPEAAWVEADPGQLEQVIANLLVNAHDAMPGGGRVRVTTKHGLFRPPGKEGGPEERYICLTVEDEGAGIPPEIQQRIFDPFFTTKELGEGTGLGLATVHGIVRQSGGEIRVESAIGEGTRFEVWLPEILPEQMPQQVAPRSTPQPPGEGATILVVEDEPGVRRFIAKALRAKGYQVMEAPEGESALRIIESTSEPIDLVLTDVRMPGVGGIELVRRLGQTHPEIKALLMSGYPEQDHRPGREAPLEILAKPIRAAELVLRVSELLSS